MKPKLVAYFNEYDAYHRHPTNRLTHKIAIPLIVFHIIAMLNWLRLAAISPDLGGWLTLAHVAFVLVVVWHLRLDTKIGFVLAGLYALCFPIASVAPDWVVYVAAVIGWGIQLAGHAVWEKRAPAFLSNLAQALVGPMYFVAMILGMWRPAGGRTDDLEAAFLLQRRQ